METGSYIEVFFPNHHVQYIAINDGVVIRYLDKVVVKDDGYEVAFKAGVTVEVEV